MEVEDYENHIAMWPGEEADEEPQRLPDMDGKTDA